MRNSSNNISTFLGHQKCLVTNGILRYFGSLIFVVGIISTILSIAVFARKPLRSYCVRSKALHDHESLSSAFRSQILLFLFLNLSHQRFNPFIDDDRRIVPAQFSTGFDRSPYEHLQISHLSYLLLESSVESRSNISLDVSSSKRKDA